MNNINFEYRIIGKGNTTLIEVIENVNSKNNHRLHFY